MPRFYEPDPRMAHATLRQDMRSARRRLEPACRSVLDSALCEALSAHRLFRSAHRIGVYLASDGEADVSGLIHDAWFRGKQTYLPVLAPFSHRRLWFTPFTPKTVLRSNRFGILEPARESWEAVKPMALDLVITPLVAYDNSGSRLGMGCGYYDRTFQFLLRRHHWMKPRLVGAAYALQRAEKLKTHRHDVPLHAIATENGVKIFD